jgi:hypothetical protein
MKDTAYEKPEVLPGDLIKCRETGGMAIIRECTDAFPGQWSVTPLPGTLIKTAWWSREEFDVVEEGPAHQHWLAGLQAKKSQYERRVLEGDIEWVITNWEGEQDNMGLTAARTILRAVGIMPSQRGLLQRGEIGIAAYEVMQLFQTYGDDIKECMSEDDPKAALAELGLRLRDRTITN